MHPSASIRRMTVKPEEPETALQLDLTSALLPPMIVRDRDGNLVTLNRMVELLADPDYPTIDCWANDVVAISTVWLGPAMHPDAPRTFEGMAHALGAAEGASWDCLTWRWDTAEEARAGHARIVQAIQERGVAALEAEVEHREHQRDGLVALVERLTSADAAPA